MSILKNLGEKCAEKVYDKSMEVRNDFQCLFLVFYEPEFVEELIEEEE